MWKALVFGAVVVGLASQSAFAQLVDEPTRKLAMSHYRAGEDAMQAESWEEAVTEFQTAIRLDPLFDLAHYSLGQAYMALKRFPEAVKAYQACVEALRSRALLNEKDWGKLEHQRDDEIRELHDSVRRAQSGQIKTPASDALILRLEERIRVLEEARMRSKQTRSEIPAEVSLALGSAYFRQGLLDDAVTAYKQAIQVNNKLGAAHNNLAAVYMLTERLKEAREELRLAEKAGFNVSPRFKDDLKKREEAARPTPTH
jgi:tetratricopeptide (TPR) repeat protein